jgi:hypothetical protein
MRKSTLQAPPARLTLCAYRPAPARVVLVYQPMPGRLLKTALSLGFFWGMIPFVVWFPPHILWVIAAFTAGLVLARRYWCGRYVVRGFVGRCPRCRRPLSLARGTRITLPCTLTCFGCHFEPCLELSAAGAPPLAEPEPLAHRAAECTGAWAERRIGRLGWLVCASCGARRVATPEAREAALAEREAGELLDALAREGRFLL